LSGVFVDTSGWASLLVRSEPYHQTAVHFIHEARRDCRRIVTSNYVLAEFSALLMSPLRVPREIRLVILNRIRQASWVELMHVDESHDAASWEYLLNRRDKDFSLVDCSSFVIMEWQRISDCLTTDRHFEQAGFLRLLK
jgi:predicted nucleic acid-binding protein